MHPAQKFLFRDTPKSICQSFYFCDGFWFESFKLFGTFRSRMVDRPEGLSDDDTNYHSFQCRCKLCKKEN